MKSNLEKVTQEILECDMGLKEYSQLSETAQKVWRQRKVARQRERDAKLREKRS